MWLTPKNFCKRPEFGGAMAWDSRELFPPVPRKLLLAFVAACGEASGPAAAGVRPTANSAMMSEASSGGSDRYEKFSLLIDPEKLISTVMPRTLVERSMLMLGSILAGLSKLTSPRLMLYLFPKNSA